MVPKIRFSEFSDEWKKNKLGMVGKCISGLTYTPKNIVNDGLLVLRSSNVKNGAINLDDCVYVDLKVDNDSLTKENDILVCVRNGSKKLIGKTALVPSCLPKATHGAFMSVFRSDMNELLFHVFQTHSYYKKVNQDLGARINSINSKNFLNYDFYLPNNKDEQQKIAKFLNKVDKKVTQLTDKHKLLKQYQKSVTQQIFSQKIRFKNKDGKDFPKWGISPLKNLAEKVSLKNNSEQEKTVLTNSARDGIVYQSDYFDKDIANQNNLSGYYIVEKDCFVYNPRISELAPVGPIKRNHLSKGVMSPLYTVFQFNPNVNIDFMELYFNSSNWFKYMKSVANFGARHDRMNITSKDFFDLPCPQPCQDEQIKITNFLKAIDNKITLVEKQLEQAKAFKQGLLQQMFV
ncbi:restriction endonuclease subunit S [Vibrio alginolyticus]|nr:restriction endonuclease subunit S [Vibrio alginolyticus]